MTVRKQKGFRGMSPVVEVQLSPARVREISKDYATYTSDAPVDLPRVGRFEMQVLIGIFAVQSDDRRPYVREVKEWYGKQVPDRTEVDDSQVQGAFRALEKVGLITPAGRADPSEGKGRPPSWFQVTKAGLVALQFLEVLREYRKAQKGEVSPHGAKTRKPHGKASNVSRVGHGRTAD